MSAASDSGSRQVVYGLNAIVQAAVLLAILILGVYFAQRYNQQWDLTSSGVNSLSESTTKLISKLPEKVTITALYSADRKSDKAAEKRIAMVRDLLSLYEGANGAKIDTFVIDPTQERKRVLDLLGALKEKPGYKGEWQPHKAAIDKAGPLSKETLAKLSDDVKKLGEFLDSDPVLKEISGAPQTFAGLQQLQRRAEQLTSQLEEAISSDAPLFGAAAEQIREFATAGGEILGAANEWMKNAARSHATASGELKEWLTGADQRYADLTARLRELGTETQNLKEPKIEEIFRDLGQRNPILVETEKEAFVVPAAEVWPIKTEDITGDGMKTDEFYNFAGEAAISSAVLRLTQKEKTAVIFVRFGGAPPFELDPMQMQMVQMTGRMPDPPPYGQLGLTLKRANFVTADWDVKSSPTPPAVEDAVRKIFVVFPPAPPEQPNRMRPPTEPEMTPEQVKAVTDAVEAAGAAVFLAGWQPPTSRFPGATGSYAYSSYLESNWGINVDFSHLAIAFAPNPEERGTWFPASRDLTILQSPDQFTFESHPLAEPVKSLPVGLRLVCPILPIAAASAPAGVTTSVVAQMPKSNDLWAVGDPEAMVRTLRERKGVTPGPDAVLSPFPVIVTASKKTGDKEQKIVVVGSDEWLRDDVALAAGQYALIGASLVPVPANPGNTDLAVNMMHWLAGNADRIAIGPRSADVPRLSRLKEGSQLTFSRWFMVGLWPGLALLIGGVVWFFRRR